MPTSLKSETKCYACAFCSSVKVLYNGSMSKDNQSNLREADDFLFYSTPDGKLKIEAYYKDETVWSTQDRMAELFDVQRPAITKHLGNIFESGGRLAYCASISATLKRLLSKSSLRAQKNDFCGIIYIRFPNT